MYIVLFTSVCHVEYCSAYFWPSVMWPLLVGPGAWIGMYGLLGIKMVWILAVLSLSRIEYLYKLENKYGDLMHINPRLPLLAMERAIHGRNEPMKSPRFTDPRYRRFRAFRQHGVRRRNRVKMNQRRRKRPHMMMMPQFSNTNYRLRGSRPSMHSMQY